MVRLFESMTVWRSWASRSLAMGAVTVLISCGGGGEGDTQAGVGSGGTGSFSSGPITAFGSIVVNGVHYPYETAKIIDADGAVKSPSDIDKRLGLMVEVDVAPVTTVNGKPSGGEVTVRYGSDLLGVVDEVNAAAGTLTVMGQSVAVISDVGNKTHFGDDLSGLIDLSKGDVVEVYGFEDPLTSVFVATRIERKPKESVTHYVVRGVVEKYVPGEGCDIGKQHINYPWKNAPEGDLNGYVARAVLPVVPTSPADRTWYASDMTVSEPLAKGMDRGEAAIDGLVTQVDPIVPTRYSVNGVPVDSSLCTTCFVPRLPGPHLAVRGSLVNGVIMATKVEEASFGH